MPIYAPPFFDSTICSGLTIIEISNIFDIGFLVDSHYCEFLVFYILIEKSIFVNRKYRNN